MAILALDQGTTSSRAVVFADDLTPLANAQQEFPQHFPQSGWVEHDPEDLWSSLAATARAAIEKAGAPPLVALGLTNQRETTVVWDRRTGRAIHNAIVWQDRRTAAVCARFKEQGHEPAVTEATGLLLDPYFSATKAAWILDHVEGAREAAKAGHLAFGTVDSFLIWRLTGGQAHVTDATNASRTMLYDIRQGQWSDDLCDLFGIPQNMLPEVKDSAAPFGMTRADLFGGALPILGVAGDQQAATVGQACFRPGMIKATYGTGCFALLNSGDTAVRSQSRLLTTIAYQLDGRPTYALEGSIFVAGAVVQWLRDGLGLIRTAAEVGDLAARADRAQRVVMVPAFTGLGAPWWEPDARGAIFGLTRATGPAELALAALESVAFQTRDLIDAMHRDWPELGMSVLRVDGGMTASDAAMQALADILGAPVDRPSYAETTVRGAAWLAAYQAGLTDGTEAAMTAWQREARFEPQLDVPTRDARHDRWTRAVRAVIALHRDA